MSSQRNRGQAGRACEACGKWCDQPFEVDGRWLGSTCARRARQWRQLRLPFPGKQNGPPPE